MKKTFKLMTLGLCLLSLACSKEEPEPFQPHETPVSQGIFVVNQGVYSLQIDGSLTYINYDTPDAVQNVFKTANGRTLGATPQDALVYGGKIYIAVCESNLIEVIDRTTFKSLQHLSLTDATGQSPRSIIAKDGKVYISMFNGYVARMDTTSMSIDKFVKVGPNPEIMAIKGNYLYVPNSDGLNWQVGYGTTASKINLTTFEVEQTFEVGLNPCQFACDEANLYLLCKGNYADIPSTIYKIDESGKSTKIAEATLMAVGGDKLYYIDAPYNAKEFTYAIYDAATGSISKMPIDKTVDSPAAIGIDPINGNIVITSYSLDNGWTSYTTDGYANVYESDGRFIRQYATGIGPCAIAFNYAMIKK